MHDALMKRLFDAIDARDTDTFLSCLKSNATFRFGSAPAVSGTSAIRDAVNAFFASISALSHDIQRLIADGATLVCQGDVTYTRHDGRSVTLPFANFFELDRGLIAEYRIYVDIAPLYSD